MISKHQSYWLVSLTRLHARVHHQQRHTPRTPLGYRGCDRSCTAPRRLYRACGALPATRAHRKARHYLSMFPCACALLVNMPVHLCSWVRGTIRFNGRAPSLAIERARPWSPQTALRISVHSWHRPRHGNSSQREAATCVASGQKAPLRHRAITIATHAQPANGSAAQLCINPQRRRDCDVNAVCH
jgi:hypothetical protein